MLGRKTVLHVAPRGDVPTFTPPIPRHTNKPIKQGIDDLNGTTPTIFATPVGGMKYVVNITDDIDSPHNYDEIIALLSTATDIDEIVFNINSYGGYVDTLNMLLGWKSMCPAKQTHVLMGNASSAATAFFLSEADNYIVGDRATFMIHEYQVSNGGTSSNSHKRSSFSHSENKKWVKGTYKGFMNDSEIEDTLKGVEFYFDAVEIRKRLQKRELLKQQEYDNQAEEQPSLEGFTTEELQDELDNITQDKKDIQKELKKRLTTEKLK